MKTKKCTKCKAEKNLDEFYRANDKNDGRTSRCGACLTEDRRDRKMRDPEAHKRAKREHYQRNRDSILAKNKEWKDKNPDKILAANRAWNKANPERSKRNNDNWARANEEQVREASRRWCRENRAKCNSITQRYRAKKRAATVEGVTVTDVQVAARWAMWGNKCYLCGVPAEGTDHVKPISKNGLHVPANLRPICGHCNSSKSAKWPYDLTPREVDK